MNKQQGIKENRSSAILKPNKRIRILKPAALLTMVCFFLTQGMPECIVHAELRPVNHVLGQQPVKRITVEGDTTGISEGHGMQQDEVTTPALSSPKFRDPRDAFYGSSAIGPSIRETEPQMAIQGNVAPVVRLGSTLKSDGNPPKATPRLIPGHEIIRWLDQDSDGSLSVDEALMSLAVAHQIVLGQLSYDSHYDVHGDGKITQADLNRIDQIAKSFMRADDYARLKLLWSWVVNGTEFGAGKFFLLFRDGTKIVEVRVPDGRGGIKTICSFAIRTAAATAAGYIFEAVSGDVITMTRSGEYTVTTYQTSPDGTRVSQTATYILTPISLSSGGTSYYLGRPLTRIEVTDADPVTGQNRIRRLVFDLTRDYGEVFENGRSVGLFRKKSFPSYMRGFTGSAAGYYAITLNDTSHVVLGLCTTTHQPLGRMWLVDSPAIFASETDELALMFKYSRFLFSPDRADLSTFYHASNPLLNRTINFMVSQALQENLDRIEVVLALARQLATSPLQQGLANVWEIVFEKCRSILYSGPANVNIQTRWAVFEMGFEMIRSGKINADSTKWFQEGLDIILHDENDFIVSGVYEYFQRFVVEYVAGLPDDHVLRSWVIDRWSTLVRPDSPIRSIQMTQFEIGKPNAFHKFCLIGLLAKERTDRSKVMQVLQLSGSQLEIYQRFGVLVFSESGLTDFDIVRQRLSNYPPPLLGRLGVISIGSYRQGAPVNGFTFYGRFSLVTVMERTDVSRILDHELWHAIAEGLPPDIIRIFEKMFDSGSPVDRVVRNGMIRYLDESWSEMMAETGSFMMESTQRYFDAYVELARQGKFNGLRILLALLEILAVDGHVPFYDGEDRRWMAVEQDANHHITMIEIPQTGLRYRFTYDENGEHFLSMSIENIVTQTPEVFENDFRYLAWVQVRKRLGLDERWDRYFEYRQCSPQEDWVLQELYQSGVVDEDALLILIDKIGEAANTVAEDLAQGDLLMKEALLGFLLNLRTATRGADGAWVFQMGFLGEVFEMDETGRSTTIETRVKMVLFRHALKRLGGQGQSIASALGNLVIEQWRPDLAEPEIYEIHLRYDPAGPWNGITHGVYRINGITGEIIFSDWR